MATTRKQYSPRFKAKVAVEAIRGERTLSQLGSQFHVHPVQIGQWRKTAMEQLADLFADGRKSKRSDGEVEKDALYEEIGRLKVELDCSSLDGSLLPLCGMPVRPPMPGRGYPARFTNWIAGFDVYNPHWATHRYRPPTRRGAGARQSRCRS